MFDKNISGGATGTCRMVTTTSPTKERLIVESQKKRRSQKVHRELFKLVLTPRFNIEYGQWTYDIYKVEEVTTGRREHHQEGNLHTGLAPWKMVALSGLHFTASCTTHKTMAWSGGTVRRCLEEQSPPGCTWASR